MEGRSATFHAAMDALIVLALLAAMAEDASNAAGAARGLRNALGLACAVLDLAFTLEFAISLADAAFEGRTWTYMVRGQGWIDCLGSLPLLILVSGPFAFAAIEGARSTAPLAVLATAGLLGPLRAFRALRLLRFVRLLSTINGFDSVTTRRHVSRAASLGVGAVVAAFLLVELGVAAGFFPGAADPGARSLASLGATLTALAVAATLVVAYGPFFARRVGAPVLASIRWANGDDTRVRSVALPEMADEEPFLLADLLDERALREAGAEPEPTSRGEIEGLLSRASAFAPMEGPRWR